jgi:hypothetical protein
VYEPINFADKPRTRRGVVTAPMFSDPCGSHRTVTSLAAKLRQAFKQAIAAGLLFASLLIGAVGFAAAATAKGQEGGVVCTGTQLAADTCQPSPLQATPIDSIPLGCKPSSDDTIACGTTGLSPGCRSGSSVRGIHCQWSNTGPCHATLQSFGGYRRRPAPGESRRIALTQAGAASKRRNRFECRQPFQSAVRFISRL